MFGYITALCVVGIFVEKGLTKSAPDFIKPCKHDDFACLMQSTIDAIPEFSKGLPELGVPPLDPFYVDKLSIPIVGVKTTFYNGKVTGFRKVVVDKIESNYKKQKLMMEFHGNVTLKGGYKAEGKILTFPTRGEGDVKIKMSNLRMKITISVHIVPDDNGVKHFSVKNYKYNFDYGDKVTYNMTNLIQGSPELSNTLLIFLNENWREVAEEFGKPVVDYATELALRTIEKFFLAVPYEELVDGPIPIPDD